MYVSNSPAYEAITAKDATVDTIVEAIETNKKNFNFKDFSFYANNLYEVGTNLTQSEREKVAAIYNKKLSISNKVLIILVSHLQTEVGMTERAAAIHNATLFTILQNAYADKDNKAIADLFLNADKKDKVIIVNNMYQYLLLTDRENYDNNVKTSPFVLSILQNKEVAREILLNANSKYELSNFVGILTTMPDFFSTVIDEALDSDFPANSNVANNLSYCLTRLIVEANENNEVDKYIPLIRKGINKGVNVSGDELKYNNEATEKYAAFAVKHDLPIDKYFIDAAYQTGVLKEEKVEFTKEERAKLISLGLSDYHSDDALIGKAGITLEDLEEYEQTHKYIPNNVTASINRLKTALEFGWFSK